MSGNIGIRSASEEMILLETANTNDDYRRGCQSSIAYYSHSGYYKSTTHWPLHRVAWWSSKTEMNAIKSNIFQF